MWQIHIHIISNATDSIFRYAVSFVRWQTSNEFQRVGEIGTEAFLLCTPDRHIGRPLLERTVFLIQFAIESLRSPLLSSQGLICGFSIATGAAARLTSGYDSYGNICGHKNVKIEGIDNSGLDLTEKKWVSIPRAVVFVSIAREIQSALIWLWITMTWLRRIILSFFV